MRFGGEGRGGDHVYKANALYGLFYHAAGGEGGRGETGGDTR